ncbi:MAG: hypothetical protein KC560_20905 [Myxococcales bacterium]|nr:hypothetical protein [Myxococcales bacterium]
MTADRRILVARIALTVTMLEFFGPMLRDYHASHAFNPDWVGHARVHLVWLLGFMFLSGLANLYLVWLRRPFEVRNLWLSVLWQSCNLGGFWIAYLLAPHYHGAITVPHIHTQILGVDENVFVFGVLSAVMAATVALLALAPRDEATS